MMLLDRSPARPTGRRYRVPFCLAAVLAMFKPPDELGLLLPAEPVQGLRPAASCAVDLPEFGHLDAEYMAPHGAITMGNDGGWCSLQFIQTFHRIYITPAISVVAPASHGEVRVQQLPERLVVAYLPAPGFVGTDHFAVRTDGPIPHNIPIEVTVR
jgi:hypothetical protein